MSILKVFLLLAMARASPDAISLIQNSVIRRTLTPAGTPAPTCVTEKVQCELDLKNVIQNDLQEDGGAIRYGNVCNVQGKPIDLIVTVDSDYVPVNVGANGLTGLFGSVNMRTGTKNVVTFSFVKPGSTAPVTVDSTIFTIYDIDGAYGWLERVVLTDFDSFKLHAGSSLNVIQEAGKVTLTSTTENIVNPAYGLSVEQLQNSVEVLYKDVSEFSMEWSVPSSGVYSPNHGRNFFFSGEAVLSKSCPPTPAPTPSPTPAPTFAPTCPMEKIQCELDLKNVIQNNLQEDGGAIRYGSVCNVNGEALDFVATVDSGYTPVNVRANGLTGSFGSVNMKTGTKNVFTFSFVKPGSTAPVTVDSTIFTIYDIDGAYGWLERVVLTNFDSVSLHAQSYLNVIKDAGKVTLTSTKENIGNPTFTYGLNKEQLQNSVEVRYKDVSKFSMEWSVPSSGVFSADHGRNFFFSGVAALSKSCATTVKV